MNFKIKFIYALIYTPIKTMPQKHYIYDTFSGEIGVTPCSSNPKK